MANHPNRSVLEHRTKFLRNVVDMSLEQISAQIDALYDDHPNCDSAAEEKALAATITACEAIATVKFGPNALECYREKIIQGVEVVEAINAGTY